MPKLPWYFKLSYLFCLPAAVVGCASLPKMPPAAVYSYSGEHGVAQFYDAPCSPIVLQLIPPQLRPLFRGGEGTYDGPTYALCWTPEPENPDVLFLIWEDGGIGRLGKEVVRPGTGV